MFVFTCIKIFKGDNLRGRERRKVREIETERERAIWRDTTRSYLLVASAFERQRERDTARERERWTDRQHRQTKIQRIKDRIIVLSTIYLKV